MSFNDLEQGRGVPDSPAARQDASQTAASRGETPEFMQLTDRVGLHIFRINANVATLQKLDKRLQDAHELGQNKTDELMKQFADLCEQTRGIVKDSTDDIKSLNAYSFHSYGGVRRSSPSLLLQSKLQRDFQDAIAAFQVIQKSGIRKEKVALAYAKQQGNDASGMDFQMQEQSTSSQQLIQTQIHAPKISQEELEFQESLIAEREAEIREIEQGVQELNEIFRDLSHMVQEQGGMIDNIEYNIGNLATNVHGADRELLQAHDYQRRTGRRALCLMMILAFVVAVVLIAVRSCILTSASGLRTFVLVRFHVFGRLVQVI